MLRTIEAIIDAEGRVRLSEPVRLDRSYRALVTILEQTKTDEEINVAETIRDGWGRDGWEVGGTDGDGAEIITYRA